MPGQGPPGPRPPGPWAKGPRAWAFWAKGPARKHPRPPAPRAPQRPPGPRATKGPGQGSPNPRPKGPKRHRFKQAPLAKSPLGPSRPAKGPPQPSYWGHWAQGQGPPRLLEGTQQGPKTPPKQRGPQLKALGPRAPHTNTLAGKSHEPPTSAKSHQKASKTSKGPLKEGGPQDARTRNEKCDFLVVKSMLS